MAGKGDKWRQGTCWTKYWGAPLWGELEKRKKKTERKKKSPPSESPSKNK